MAGVSINVYELDSVVRGQHVYKSAWTPFTDKMHKCIMRKENEHDKCTLNDQL